MKDNLLLLVKAIYDWVAYQLWRTAYVVKVSQEATFMLNNRYQGDLEMRFVFVLRKSLIDKTVFVISFRIETFDDLSISMYSKCCKEKKVINYKNRLYISLLTTSTTTFIHKPNLA